MARDDPDRQRHWHVVGRFDLDQYQRDVARILNLLTMAPSRGPQPLARTLHQTLKAHKGTVNVATYAKGTAKYLVSGGQDRIVRLWNPSVGTEIKAYSGHGYEVLSIAVWVPNLIIQPGVTIDASLVPSAVRTIIVNSRLREETELSSCGM